MRAKLSHAQRGQAIVETVVFLPLFVLVFFGIIWTVQAAVQSERVQSAIRYAGLISQRANPYADYSLYSMYRQLGLSTLPASLVPCVIPSTDALSDAAPTYASHASPPVTTASAPFWSPSTVKPPQPSCTNNGLFGFARGTGFTQDVILSEQQPGMLSYVPVPATLVNALGTSLTSSFAGGYFFKSVGVNVLMACYASLNKQVTSSLQYTTDTSTADPPIALGAVVTPVYLTSNTACTTP